MPLAVPPICLTVTIDTGRKPMGRSTRNVVHVTMSPVSSRPRWRAATGATNATPADSAISERVIDLTWADDEAVRLASARTKKMSRGKRIGCADRTIWAYLCECVNWIVEEAGFWTERQYSCL